MSKLCLLHSLIADSECKCVSAVTAWTYPTLPDFQLMAPNDYFVITITIRALNFMLLWVPFDIVIPFVDNKV